MIQYIKTEHGYDVMHENGVKLGEIESGLDGFYHFWDEGREGYWPAELLLDIGNKLKELNEEWQKNIDNYFLGELKE